MFKQELPLLFPDDAEVARSPQAIFDPFEYLMLRHKGGQLNTDFKGSLGKVVLPGALPSARAEHRAQDEGASWNSCRIPRSDVIERCSGHDGTYGVKKRISR